MTRLPTLSVLAVAGFVALAIGAAADRLASSADADVARGTEDVFAHGLQAREIPPRQGPQRWTTERAVFTFKYLPRGSATLEVAVHGQREAVTVVCDGVILGQVCR